MCNQATSLLSLLVSTNKSLHYQHHDAHTPITNHSSLATSSHDVRSLKSLLVHTTPNQHRATCQKETLSTVGPPSLPGEQTLYQRLSTSPLHLFYAVFGKTQISCPPSIASHHQTMNSPPATEPPLAHPLPADPPLQTDQTPQQPDQPATAPNAEPDNPPPAAANQPNAPPRRRRNRRKLPRFARSYPLLYRLLLLAATLNTPLTLLTILSTSGYLHRHLSLSSPGSSSSSRSLSKLGFVSPFGLNLGVFVPRLQGVVGLKWKTCTVALWWVALGSFWSRHLLVGTSVWWVLNGWEEGGDREGELR